MSDATASGRRDQVRIAAMELQLSRTHEDPAYFHGYLMLPLLREGDEVEVEPITGSDVRVGDVVTYREADKFPTRRVMEIRDHPRLLVVTGDSVRPRQVWQVAEGDVLGRVARRRRDGRWMTNRHWRWRLQRAKALGRYRLAASAIGGVWRRVRHGTPPVA